MRRLFVEPEALRADPILIEGPDHHHLAHVLRARPGERLHLLDGSDAAWEAEVLDVGRSRVRLARIAELPAPPRPARHILIAQALGKGDRFETALQHATEAGASGFIPLITERGIPRLDALDLANRAVRWRRVLKGAAEQAARASIPDLEPPGSVAEVAARYASACAVFLLHPGGTPLAYVLDAQTADRAIVFLVGPEGGFTEAEIEQVRAQGGAVVSLGAFVLRTETAGVFATAQALYAASAARAVLESS